MSSTASNLIGGDYTIFDTPSHSAASKSLAGVGAERPQSPVAC